MRRSSSETSHYEKSKTENRQCLNIQLTSKYSTDRNKVEIWHKLFLKSAGTGQNTFTAYHTRKDPNCPSPTFPHYLTNRISVFTSNHCCTSNHSLLPFLKLQFHLNPTKILMSTRNEHVKTRCHFNPSSDPHSNP